MARNQQDFDDAAENELREIVFGVDDPYAWASLELALYLRWRCCWRNDIYNGAD